MVRLSNVPTSALGVVEQDACSVGQSRTPSQVLDDSTYTARLISLSSPRNDLSDVKIVRSRDPTQVLAGNREYHSERCSISILVALTVKEISTQEEIADSGSGQSIFPPCLRSSED